VKRSWTVIDFVLVWLGGFFGATLAIFAVEAFDLPHPLAIGLIGQFVGTFGVLWLLARSKEDASLGWSVEPKDLRYLALGIGLQFVIAPLMAPLVRHLFPDGRPPQEIADIIGSPDTAQFIKIFLFLTAVVFAPLLEEVVFRGVLLKALLPRGKTVAIVASSIIFAGVHLSGLRTDRYMAAVAVTIPPLLILGALLAWVTVRSGRLGPAIFMHSGWNLLAAIVLLLPPEILEQLE